MFTNISYWIACVIMFKNRNIIANIIKRLKKTLIGHEHFIEVIKIDFSY